MNTTRAICVLVVTIFAFASVHALPDASDEEYEIFELINRERVKARLSQLEWDDRVANVARNFSRQMARDGFFNHVDGEGRSVVDRAGRIRWSKIGENLFMCSDTDDLGIYSVRSWMRSPSHRKNILDREWTATGIGVYKARNGRTYVTQVFVRQ